MGRAISPTFLGRDEMYKRFFMWCWNGLRGRIEAEETEPLDKLKYFLVMRLPFPKEI